MFEWVNIIANIGLLWIASLCLVRLNKCFRGKRGALAEVLCLDDVIYALLFSCFITASQLADSLLLSIVVFAFTLLYIVLLWLDAMLFVQFRIEVNRQTISWFLTGSKGLSKGIPHLMKVFQKYYWACCIPVFWTVLLSVSIFGPGGMKLFNVVLAIFLSTILGLKFQGISLLKVVIAVTAIFILTSFVDLAYAQWVFGFAALAAFSALVVGSLAIYRKFTASTHRFLSTPSLLGNIVLNDSFIADERVNLKSEHQALLQSLSHSQVKSPAFGRCKGANIILVTMESMGAYINPYVADGAHSKIAQRMAQHSWFSKQHFCLCPNTTVSTNQMYTGAYSNNPYNKDDSLYPGVEPLHIKHLKANGYKTLFLDSANIGLYDYHKLLSRIGFDQVWGTDDLPDEGGLKADYRLWNMVDKVAEQVAEQPFYLHLINDQTHMPYEVVDKQRFNRHSGQGDKSVYLNALEECDFIVDEFLKRLGEKVDLSNTILVFTGDHGESFGEFGYSFHSNSVIKPQVHVPFMLNHPQLASKELEHSSHFDLFPTFFDLLGIEYNYSCIGDSLGLDNRKKCYFFHSATLKGNTPANFGLLLNDELVWVDRLFNQVRQISFNTNSYTNSVGDESVYSKNLMYQILLEQGILSE